MYTIKNNQVNYLVLHKSTILQPIFGEIRLSITKVEDNITKILTGVGVIEYDTFYVVHFLETQNEDLTDGEIDLASRPVEYIIRFQEYDLDLDVWNEIASDVLKVYPRVDPYIYPNTI